MQRSSEDFIELLKPLYSNAISYCIALTRNEVEAKDLLQDSLLKALEQLAALRDDKKFKSWLFTILTRQYYALYRKSLIKKKYLNHSYHDTLEFPEIFEKEANEHEQKALLEALGQLTEKERVAIVLFEVADFSMEEIRMIQGEKSISAIKSRISRTRLKLKELIQTKILTNR
jgi:RNA polymerase sigma-70 factor, ECF subfamily